MAGLQETLHLDNSMAFIYPGQGGQAVRLGMVVAERSSKAWRIKEMAGDYFGGEFLDTWQNGPVDKVNKTRWTQYIMATDGLMRQAALEDEEKPEGTENWFGENGASREKWRDGLSLGIIVAGAGVWYTAEEAIKFINERGRVMGEFFQGLDAKMFALEDVDKRIRKEMLGGFNVRLCLDNTSTQQVYGGPVQEVTAALRWLEEEREQTEENVKLLEIEGVYHHPILEPVVLALTPVVSRMIFFEEALHGKILMSNITGLPLETADALQHELLGHNLTPVQHRKSMEYLVGEGVNFMAGITNSRRLAIMDQDMFGGDSRVQITMKKRLDGDKPPVLIQAWRAD